MVIINIDAAGSQGTGKTIALSTITRSLAKKFRIITKEYLNDSEHQIRIKCELKAQP